MQEPEKKSAVRVVLLGTGGTISGRSAQAGDNIGYAVGEVGIADMVAGMPGTVREGFTLVTEQIAQIDSKDMGVSVWQGLATRCTHYLAQEDVQAVVITHGTDTMEETAYFLLRVLSGAGIGVKPVVLTGAMRPASSMNPDGPGNLRDALAVASDPRACGVLVVMAGKVFGALEVQKVHGYRLDAFEARDGGPLGYVEEGRMRTRGPLPGDGTVPVVGRAANWHSVDWPRVEIVASHAGADAFVVDALLAHCAGTGNGLRGIVVAGTGNGTVHRDLEAALLRAQACGVAVVRATRCAEGRVLAGARDVLPHAGGLSPVKARIAMMLALMEQDGAAGSGQRG